MRLASITIGINKPSNWKIEDQVQLPDSSQLNPVFLPEVRPLNEILHRPSLDERLPKLLQPKLDETEFLLPSVLSDTRKEAQQTFAAAAVSATGEQREVLKQTASLLMSDVILEEDLKAALAALLQG